MPVTNWNIDPAAAFVPAQYGLHGYRYTVVNGRPVLVDRSHGLVEIID